MFVSASHELSQEYREFERCSTVVANAYIGPRVRSYVADIDEHIRKARFPRLVPARAIDRRPVRVRAGEGALHPHAGIRPGRRRHRRAGAVPRLGIDDAIAFDMGGTTAKAGVIHNGEALTTGAALDRRLQQGAADPDRDDRHFRGRHRRRQHRARRRRRPARRPAERRRVARARPATASAARSRP